MRQLGLLTYPLYLVHQVMGFVLVDTLRRQFSDLQAVLIAMAACLVLAFAVSRYLEPALRGVLARQLGIYDRLPLRRCAGVGRAARGSRPTPRISTC